MRKGVRMISDFALKAPFFELGPKAYIFGDDLVALARHADGLSAKYDVRIILTPQAVDIPRLVRETSHLLIFAQHMDPVRIGRGNGSVLPEALKAAGAEGTMLNHAEKPLAPEVLEETISRADEVGLATLVCAGDLQEVERISRLAPNIIIAESPDLIGAGSSSAEDRPSIPAINRLVQHISPKTRVLHAAGISNGKDVYDIIAAGAEATGSTSGVLKAPDPLSMLEEMISNVRSAWDQTHR
ncbi:MAG: triose-phosphate isomerase [Anaerolineales bacterium]